MQPVRNKAKCWCEVLQCHSDSRKSLAVYPFMRGVRFFPFPINSHMRQIWTKLIRRGDDWDGPKQHQRVCSRHFVDGEPSPQNPAPTIFPWTSSPTILLPKTDYPPRHEDKNQIIYAGNNPIMTTTGIDATDESHINNPSQLQCLKKRKLSKQKERYQKVKPDTESSEDDSFQQLTPPALEVQTTQLDETHFQQKNQFENTYSETRHMFAAKPATVTAPSALVTAPSALVTAPSAPVTAPSTLVTAPPTLKHVPVLAPPGQKVEPKPVQKHQHQVKKRLVIANHQQSVMSKLSSLWKDRKLCDAAIGNGTSIVKVHKVVLSAVCPKLLSVLSTDILSQEFVQVNFPKEVSKEALNAFAEYMYNGSLDLDIEILKQLKIIARKLNKKEFEQLCDSYLPNNVPQSADAVKLPLIQKVKSVPAMTSALASLDSPVTMDYTPSAPTQVVNINQESMEVELGQVKMEMGHMFGQESEVASLAPNKSGNDICPNIKTEPAGRDNNKYGHLSSSSSNQVFTSTTSSSPSSLAAGAASTSISSVPASSTKFPIPFSQSTDGKSTRLKPSPSYESPLVSDLSPVSHIIENVYSQSSDMNEDSSKQLNRQSISTSPIYID